MPMDRMWLWTRLVSGPVMTRRDRSRLASGSTLLGLLLGLVMVGFSLASVAASPSSAVPASAIQIDGHRIGNPDAKVQIVMYYDLQCSHCQGLYYGVEGQLIQRYVATGKARLDARPLDFLGPASLKAATALMAATDQGRYWDYLGALWGAFRASGPGAYTDDSLKALASRVGLDRGRFDAAFASPEKAAEVKAFGDQAKAQGVKAVPYTLINGRLVEGDQPLDVFVKMIDEELAK